MADEDPRGEPATDRLLYLVNRVARALNRAADDIAAAAGVTLPELMALLVLGEGEGVSNAQLARRTFVSSQAGHQVVGQLLDRGLIDRRPHPSNRRMLVTELTEEGWVVLAGCRSALAAFERRMLDGMSPEHRELLGPALLDAALTLRGGWFGDQLAEAASIERRATGSRGRAQRASGAP